MPMAKPITYQISKVENTIPKGVNKFTLYQGEFNEHTDYVDLETGEMYADYYSKSTNVIEENSNSTTNNKIILTCALAQIKIGGGYKTITATVTDENGNDITSKYKNFKWTYLISGKEVENLITESNSAIDINKTKIKFLGDEEYLENALIVKCKSDSISSELELNIVAL